MTLSDCVKVLYESDTDVKPVIIDDEPVPLPADLQDVKIDNSIDWGNSWSNELLPLPADTKFSFL